VVSFTPWPLYLRGSSSGTHWIGGWVNPRAGLDDLQKRKFLTLAGLQLRPPSRSARSQSLYENKFMAPSYRSINMFVNNWNLLRHVCYQYYDCQSASDSVVQFPQVQEDSFCGPTSRTKYNRSVQRFICI
jgi:hypothetical protein